MGYTKVTTQGVVFPSFVATPVVTENYRFVYDGNNRVSQIFFTSNDQAKVLSGIADLSIKFYYSSDSIYKTTTDLRTSTVKERDTFLVNLQGQVVTALFPWEVHKFTYYGKLLATESVTFRDTGTLVTANLIYTSNNGDLLYRLFDGNLYATFPDSGIRSYIPPTDTFRDTILSLPLHVVWSTYLTNGTVTFTDHMGVGSYSDVLSGYSQNMVSVDAVDDNFVRVRTVFFPAGYTAKQQYEIYDFLDERPGDYLQLESFTTYGINLYQQKHMMHAVTNEFTATKVAYSIDADSKVTNTNVVIKDSLTKNTTSIAYKLQYETNP